jgi:hypothetical protein
VTPKASTSMTPSPSTSTSTSKSPRHWDDEADGMPRWPRGGRDVAGLSGPGREALAAGPPGRTRPSEGREGFRDLVGVSRRASPPAARRSFRPGAGRYGLGDMGQLGSGAARPADRCCERPVGSRRVLPCPDCPGRRCRPAAPLPSTARVASVARRLVSARGLATGPVMASAARRLGVLASAVTPMRAAPPRPHVESADHCTPTLTSRSPRHWRKFQKPQGFSGT